MLNLLPLVSLQSFILFQLYKHIFLFLGENFHNAHAHQQFSIQVLTNREQIAWWNLTPRFFCSETNRNIKYEA